MAPNSHGWPTETLALLRRQVEDASTRSSSAPGSEISDDDDWAAKLAAQAEKSWTVSGASVLSAWGMAFTGSLLILLFFSWRRTKDPIIHLPRYLTLISREPKHHHKRKLGEWHPYIPTSDPARRPEGRGDEEWVLSKKLEGMEDEAYILKHRINSEKKWDRSKVPRKVKGMELNEGFLSWMRPAWRDFKVEINIFDKKAAVARDRQLLDYLGLDAFTFLEFLRLLRWLFALITVFVASPLLCANYFINTRTEWGSSSSASGELIEGDIKGNSTGVKADLQLFTGANITGNAWWVHISAEFVVTMIVSMQVLIYSRRHERVMEIWSDMNAEEVAFKTILITGLEIPGKPKDSNRLTVQDAKRRILLKIGCPISEPVEITIKQENMSKLAEKIKIWNEVEGPKVAARLQRRLDSVKNGNGGKSEGGGCLGWILGNDDKEDAQVVSEAVGIYVARKQDQKNLKKGEHGELVQNDVTAAFVTWRTAKAAHLKLQELHLKKDKKFKAERCPRSVCVLWRNLEKDPQTIAKQKFTGALVRWGITILNSIPVMIITLLTNLDGYIDANPGLKEMRETSTFWNAVFTAAAGVIPASLAAIFIMALPYIMRALSRFQGALSIGQIDKDVIRQMFIFLLLSKFVVFSLFGIGYDTYQTIKDQIGRESLSTIFGGLGDVPAKVTKAYISQSSYWLSFFPIKCAVVCLQLTQLPRYLIKGWDFFLARKANTADRLEVVAQPAGFEYAIEYTNILFGLVVALVYTPLAPIVSICGAMYFWTASIVYQNQLTFVEESIETDGKVWKVVMNRLLAALSFMQILMTLTVLLKTQPFADSSLPITPRILPSIFAFLPIFITWGLTYHVKTRRTTAQIISDRESSTGDSNTSSKIPKFDLDILRPDALKLVKVLPGQEEELIKLSQVKGFKGLELLVPQLKRKVDKIKQAENEAKKEAERNRRKEKGKERRDRKNRYRLGRNRD